MEGKGDDDGLEEFMEVVTMYRCKFCVFTTPGPKEMAQHVKKIHVAKPQVSESISLSVSSAQTTPTSINEVRPGSVTGFVYNESEAVTEDELLTVRDVSQNQISTTRNSSQSLCTTVSTLNLPVGTSSSASQNMILTLPGHNEQIVVEPLQSTGNQVTNVSYVGQQIGDYQVICQNQYGQYVLQNSGNVQLGNTNAVNVLVQDSSAQPRPTIDAVTAIAEEQPMGVVNLDELSTPNIKQEMDVQTEEIAEVDTNAVKQMENEDEIITKELYLCGNCSEGFATIQACKDHMTLVHDVTDFQTSCRVDAGTQVEPRKRPGRKKKSETVEQEKIEEEEDIVMSDTDEDWAEQLLSYSTRSHRKRKPPQALRNDYYLGRTKRKEQKKREPRELNVACEFEGCTMRFQDEDTMKTHVNYHIPEAGITGPQFRCTVCEEQFDNWKLTRIHMWKAHKIGVDLLNCPLCDSYKTDTPSKLKIHLETHGDVRAYTCPVCGKAFKQFAQMKNHETCHLPREIVNSKELSDKWHTPKTCDICGRRFVNVKCMRKHKEAVHAGKKDFKCSYCNYECARKAMLVLHVRTHTGDKPFKCDMCSYCCGDHNSLRRHKMRHTGQKPYRCPHCPYASIQAISLKVHVKNKHPGMGGIFCCDLCMYRTVNQKQFENHQMDHKNGLIKTEPNVKAVQIDVSKVSQAKGPETVIIGTATPMVYSNFTENQNIIQVLHPQVSQSSNVTQNSTEEEMIESDGTRPELENSSLILDGGQVGQLHQLQMTESDVNIVENNSGLEPNDVAAAQLIYTALSEISENPLNGLESMNSQRLLSGVENGELQTSIETHVKEGLTTYKITFHLPEGNEITREIAVQDQSVTTNGTNMNSAAVNDWQENSNLSELEQAS